MRSIREVKNIKGKIVLLRADLNVETVQDSFKLQKAIPTIEFLHQKGAITVVMSHRGRPEGKVRPELSLKMVLPFLRKQLNAPVHFLSDWHPRMVRPQIANAEPGDVFLMENIRFYPEEDRDDASFGHQLASMGDLFVNDAFPSHHKGASVDQIPKFLPSYAGFVMEQEISNLSKVMRRPKKPLVVILAGGKATDKFAVIENLYSKTDKFLIGGILANTFFKAAGMRINGSIVDFEILPKVKKMLNNKKIILPMDWVTNDSGKILDLGPLSTELFISHIGKAGTIIWNGPVGQFEDPRFKAGSVAIAQAIAKSKAYSVVGGGETTSLILDLNLQDKIGFLSTGGGAMLAFLAGKSHAGIEALEK